MSPSRPARSPFPQQSTGGPAGIEGAVKLPGRRAAGLEPPKCSVMGTEKFGVARKRNTTPAGRGRRESEESARAGREGRNSTRRPRTPVALGHGLAVRRLTPPIARPKEKGGPQMCAKCPSSSSPSVPKATCGSSRARSGPPTARAGQTFSSNPAQTDAPRKATRSLSWRVSTDRLNSRRASAQQAMVNAISLSQVHQFAARRV